ncbi:hypothetical protein ASF53_02005 [Methylobacterium sp. Leaf123]|uniref:host specificity factor TipJ family phage tail protein n=1 Tax=Methylobacterium sp. Leaf123 TaxID=1736264 RepID=UPI0007013C82|nr:host specificity factor TipJ family phage tail protein [Methylobacterium sp. Leaf123]KQQ31496.1 hypothetical protein ASF53_02005 [Methylobacterium sp. Leaf123]
MTVVALTNVAGQARGEPIRLAGRRRRLSTIVARHRPVGRRILVSVHRNAIDEASLVPSDATVRLRETWSRTLVGPRDVVVITILPLGGGGSSSGGGGSKSPLGIGLAIASIALIAIAPYAAPALAGAAVFGAGVGATTGTLATAIQVGMVVGGVALGAAAQLANGAGAKTKNRTLYSVSGGGNVPREGARKPLLYGRCWSTPPLSQRDFFRYEGDTMVLTKRMTLGLGRFKIHAIKAGGATFWTEAGGLEGAFNVAGNAVEFPYETASQLAVGDAVSSGDVAGLELPRPGSNPAVTPWYRLQPQGVSVDQALLSWSYQSVSRTSSAGRQAAGYAGVVFMARRIDPVTGAGMGAPFELLRDAIGPVLSPATALRYSRTVRLPARGAYEVYGQNLYPDAAFAENKASWDELVGLIDDVRIRPATSEIVIQVRAGPGLNFAAFSDVSVLATRILPVWNGSTWTEEPTRKAVWAAADLVRNEYGLDQPEGFDLAKALHYIGELKADDTFDGALPEVSSYWEAAGIVLLPMRADPVKVGVVHSFVRDESRAEPRHVLTRRQIVRDSGGASFQLLGEGGDVIVEFDRDGDPKRPDEARYSYGTPSRTPRRYKVPGITDGDHAYRHAKWLALVSVFRGASRTVVTEWDGRLVYPGDHVLSDLWFLKGPVVYGVAGAVGRVLTLDCDANLSSEWGFGSIRTRFGREWGILRMRGLGARRVELHPDDVAIAEARLVQTVDGPIRLALADVLARDTQDPTTLVVGELEELQETYVVRAALPTDADHVRIEMLQDDRRIWELLGEEVRGPVPVNPDALAEPLLPNIKTLRGRCERIETGIEVVWSIAPPRGARSYDVWLSYDGDVTRERLSSGTAIEGRAPIRQSEAVVTLIAVAYGSTGLAGREAETTFSTVAPIVRGEVVDISTLTPIPYEKLGPDAQGKIAEANAKADVAKAAADAASQEAASALASAYGRVDELIRGLAVDPAVRVGHINAVMGDVRKDISLLTEATFRLLADVATLRDNQAAAGIEILPDEGRVRIAAVAKLEAETGQRLTSLSVLVDALKGQIDLYGSVQGKDVSGLVTDINAVRVRLDAVAATVSTLATSAQFDGVSARLGTAEQTITAQGAAIEQRATLTTVNAQGVRLSSAETRISATEGSIRNVVTAAGTSAVDLPLMVGTLAQMLDYLGEQTGGLYEHVARAETATSANFDEAGRSVAEVSTRLLAFQDDTAAQFLTVTRAIAGNGEALVQSQTLLSAQVGKVAADVTSEIQVRAAADAAQTTRIDGAVSRIGTAEARIVTEEQTRASETGALSQRAASLEARTGTNEAGIMSLNRAVTDNQSATASQFQGVNARFGTVEGKVAAAEGNIQTLFRAYADGDSALSQRIDTTNARVGGVEAGLVTEQKARADSVSAQAERTTRLTAQTDADRIYLQGVARQTDSDRGYFLASERARIDTEGALSQQIAGLGARVGNNEGTINQVSTALSNTVQAQAGTNIDLYARSDAGTAFGRIRFEGVSAPAGVAVRFSIQLSTERNGFYRNSGLFMDILGDGSSRILFDANLIAFTANGGTTYPFRFTGAETYIDTLRVGPGNLLPNSISQSNAGFDPNSNSISFKVNVRPGSAVLIFAEFYGQPDQPLAPGQQGILRIARDGVALRDKGMNYYVTRAANGNTVQTLGTEAFYRDVPPPGERTYTIAATNGQSGVAYTFFEITGS